MADDPIPDGVATTALFVELLVIGAGAAASLSPVLAAFVGWGWLNRLTGIGPLVLFLIAGVYVLGIVTDRFADAVGEPISRHWRRKTYPAQETPWRDYEADLLRILKVSPLASRLAYGRSRLRVCRGWLLNCVLAAMSTLVYVFAAPNVDHPLALVVATEAAVIALAIGCAYAWHQLAVAQYDHVRAQSGERPSEDPAPQI